jgi:transmembrane sensor
LNARDDNGGAMQACSDPAPPRPPAGPPNRSSRAWAPAVLAGAIVLGLWGPNLVRPPPPAWTTYISLKGQTRRMQLGDRSLLRLNGATSVKVVFEDRLRRAVFEGGEAEFDVAPNGRPFQMAVGDRDLRTRDADFNLRRYGRVGAVKATLTVRRGQVEVGDVRGRDSPRTLGPDDQMTWIEGQPAAPTRNVDPNLTVAWESHRLVYDKTPLSDVVMDLNRYVDRPISIVPAALGDLPFSGLLILDSEDRMIKRLEQTLPIQAQTLPAAIVLKPRQAAAKPRPGRAHPGVAPAQTPHA